MPASLRYANGGGPVIDGDVKLSNFSLVIGIGSSSSNLDLEMVYNNCGGAGGVQLPPIGSAVRFQCGALYFGGIVNSCTYSQNSNGISYKFKIIDPRKVLEMVSVMLKDYYCALNAPNFINAMYYMEQGVGVCPNPGSDTENWPRLGGCGSFGRSGGPSSTYLKMALMAVQTSNAPIYTTSGDMLRLNISSVVAACPQYATVSGSSSSLLGLITQACDEGACDFTVTLEGNAITVWTIKRFEQPPTKVIENIISAAQSTGTLISSEIGFEEMYGSANKVVLGEKVSYMTTAQTRGRASMMLGYDSSGQPVRVYGANFTANIDISGLSESMRSLAGVGLPNMFPITEEEILCSGSVELWKLYGTIKPGSLAGYLLRALGIQQKMRPVYDAFMRLMSGGDQAASNLNTVNRSPRFAAKEPKVVLFELAHKWLTDWAADWYGKKWLIPINSFCVSPLPMTSVISDGGPYYMSDAPTDAGWPTNANLLGLSYGSDTSIFESSDGKLCGFVVLPLSESISRNIYGKSIDFVLSPDGLSGDYLLKNNRAYIKVNTDGPVFRNGNTAEVLITSPFMGMTAKLNENLLSFGLTALACLMQDASVLKQMETRQSGYADITSSNIYKMGMASAGFDFATIPMKSNVYVYGPWTGGAGAIGGTEVISTDLSPWNYGTYEAMERVGSTLASTGFRNSNITETGSMTVAEPPGYSIQYFLGFGVLINSINVNYNSGGATTNYNFQTYSAKFGQYGKALADSVKQSVKARNEIFSFVKEQRRRTIALTNTMRSSFSRATSINTFRTEYRSSINSASPGNVLVGGYHDPSAQRKVIEIGLNSKKEYETAVEGAGFQNMAIMSLDGLFMPVSIKGRNNYLPRYMANFKYEKGNKSRKTRPSMPPLNGDQDNTSKAFPINQTYLNPILSSSMFSEWTDGRGRSSSTTIQALGFGTNSPSQDLYGPIDSKYDSQTDFGFYALRGPLVLQSWGYDTENKPIPNAVDSPSSAMAGQFNHENTRNKFLDDWLAKPETWPIGPVDLRFDRDRGVWVCPPPDRILLAELTAELKESGCAEAKLLNPTLSGSGCSNPKAFYDQYKIWGSNGESLIDQIEKQKITVYNFLNNTSISKGEKIYVVYNDDKYLAIPKGGGSKIKVCKYEGEWKINEAKDVTPYKVTGEKNHKTDPSKGNLEGDGDYQPVKALNLLRTVKPNSDGEETWCIIADIGSSFHVVIAFGSGCPSGHMDAGLIDPNADMEAALDNITQGSEKVQILVNNKGCATWWNLEAVDVLKDASLESSELKFDKKKIFALISSEEIEPATIPVAACEEETGSGVSASSDGESPVDSEPPPELPGGRGPPF
jgi:hypothetical protein